MASHESVHDEPKGAAEPWVGEGSADGVELPKPNDIGALAFDEYTQGGLGRHLGVVSTTFLVYVQSVAVVVVVVVYEACA